MNLSNKLNMLAGKSSFDSDNELTGLSTLEDTNYFIYDNENSEDDVSADFNLGELSIDSYLQDSGYKSKKKNKKSKRQKTYEYLFGDVDESGRPKDRRKVDEIVETTKRLVQAAELASADEFDDFLDDESLFNAEEDAEMRNNLISLGRKYARDSAASKESSEITKSFADSEKRLKSLYEELDKDKASLQKDIERMRVPGRGGKSLAEMISVKNSMQSTQLSIVKEVNALRKNIFDMRQKEAARKDDENAGSNDINANTLQSIFSSSRSGLVNSMGGYSGVSGARNDNESDYSVMVSDEMDDEEIQRRYFSDDKSTTSSDDGSKFLQYEDRGVEYVLLVDSNDKVQEVIAEDRDGNLIPDYPLPNDIDGLSFEIDHTAKMATDNLHRNYHVRIVD
jgi:hypothetical protein